MIGKQYGLLYRIRKHYFKKGLDIDQEGTILTDMENMTNETTDPIRQLKAVLERYSITQEAIASEIGIADGTLSRILNGHQEPLKVVLNAISRWLSDNSEHYPV